MKLNRFKRIKWLVFAFVVLSPVVLAIILFENKYENRFYPGVIVGGESVGGKTYDEILNSFKTKSDSIIKNGLTLIFEHDEERSKEVQIPILSTGLTSDTLVEYFSLGDWEKTLEEAYAWGRNGSFIKRSEDQFLSLLGKNFNFSLSSPHEEAIQSLLARETKNFLIAGVSAQFAFSGGGVVITPEKIGDNIDSEKVIDVVSESLKILQADPIVFKIKTKIPFVTEERLKPHLPLVKELAKSANVNFYYQKRKWKVSGRTLIAWLTLDTNEELKIDTKKLEGYLAKSVVPLINNPPQNSRFQMQDGKLVEIFPGKSGNIVDIKKTIEKVEKIIPSVQKSFAATADIYSALALVKSDIKFDATNHTIDVLIETMTVSPTVTKETIEQFQIKDLIGSSRTNFSGGSKDRQHNIELGVSKLTGILIAPGEEFSAVKALGAVTEEEGFLKEFVIKGDQTVKELGGGLCQLATTLFRAALSSGLPITERTNHRYVISYYGPGVDATIYGPHPDLRFVNDTGNYLLLQGKVKGNEAIFELYGTSDGRTSDVSEAVLSDEKPVPETRIIMSPDIPAGEKKCTSTTHKGITADVTYKVQYSDGSTKEQKFNSVYEAWPKVCLVGPPISPPVLDQQ